MLGIAGQTAGPIGLKFFVDTYGWPGFEIFFPNFFLILKKNPRATPGTSTCYYYYYIIIIIVIINIIIII